MELIERIPLDKINFLNSLTFKQFKQFEIFKSSCKNEEERKIQFNILKSFCQTNIKTRGETKRIYSFTEKTPLDVGGRLYCGNSIQGLSSKVRGFLLNEITTDIDMKNAHPVILKYLCKVHKTDCANLSYYITNRDSVLERLGKEYKTEFLKAVNTDKTNKKIKDDFFKNFDAECKTIQNKLTSLDCYKHIVNTVPLNKEYNWLGSAINRILCVYENKILQEAISFINSKQIEICSLMFDGLMVYGNYYDNDELLVELADFVNGKFEGLDIVFTYKEHLTEIEIPDDYLPEIIEIEDTFEQIAEKFELTHCKINNKGFFIKETPEKNIIMTKQHLITTYEHMTYRKLKDDKVVECNFINDWLKNNPKQRCFDDIECYPDSKLCPKTIFNTWRPFAMELVSNYTPNMDALVMVRKHIKVLCGNDEVVANYLECWIAQMIQYPAVKSNCPTIISKQGAGKGTLLKLICAMIGEDKYFETTTPSRDVWGDFNGRMANTFLVNLDELSRKESLECEGKIKGLITNPRMNINEKGVKHYGIISYHRFIGTTNNEDPIKTEKDDRRNWIIRASDELIGNVEYFNKINEYINDTNVVKTCYEYFKSIPDMINFNKIPMPVTEYQADMKEQSVSPIENWLKSFVLDNYYETEVEKFGKDLFVLFNEWCKKCNIEYKINIQAFGVRLKRLNINGIEKGKHTNKGETKVFNIEKLKNHFDLNNIIIDDTKDDTDKEDMTLDDDSV
jgi:hypothetical protein